VQRRQILKLIGANIRKARLRANITQEGLAEMIDIHWKTLGYIEAGKRDFGVSILAKIVLALKIPLDRVLEGVSIGSKENLSIIAKIATRKRAISN
jgi:transcriptional regulator with XRE-family HTH domain